jgi:uncharacterized protein (TIGR02421 family)
VRHRLILALLAALPVSARSAPDPTALALIDRELHELTVKIRPLDAVQPTGADSQRADFEEGRIRNPVLRYENPVDYSPAAMEAELRSLWIPRQGAGRFLADARDSLQIQNRIVRYRGTAAVPWLTTRLYGRPDARLVERARGILEELESEGPSSAPPVELEAFADHLRAELAAYGLDDWKVLVMAREGSTHVNAGAREVRVSRRATVPASVPARLAVHEVGVHVLRAANGYLQPYRVLATGTAGYQDTEEGLAAYCEVVTGTAQPSVLRKYAARVLAIDAMLRGLDFRATHTLLRSFDIPLGIAWETTLRAFRGGGYAKDHVYLDGLFRVLDHVASGGRLESLFVGKIRVADVPRIEAMVAAGELRPARYLPRRLGEPPVDGGRLLRFLQGL